MQDEYLNLTAASEYLGVSLVTLRDKIRRGKLHIAENQVDARERLIAKSELDMIKKPTAHNSNNQHSVKVDANLVAELNRRAAMPDSEFLTEAESEADTAAMLDRVERELQLAS